MHDRKSLSIQSIQHYLHNSLPTTLALMFILTLTIAGILTRCSLSGVTLGGGTSTLPNDPIPAGSLVVQGTFAGQNGQTASGTAAIYANGTAVTLRLSNLVTTVTTGLQAQVYGSNSSSALCTINLVYYTGSKNYSCQAATSGTYSYVNLYSIPNQINYAVAQLF